MSDESLIAFLNKEVPEMSSTRSTVDNNCVVKKGGPTLPAGIYTGICLALFAWMYFPAYQYMSIKWGLEDYNHCYLIPVIVMYILWEKRTAFRAVSTAPSWFGLVPLGIGVVLFWLGELGGEFYTIHISSWFVMIGMAWTYLGWNKLKLIGFPLCFLITMFPFPNLINNNLTLRLKLISSELGVAMLRIYGMSAYREGNVIDVGFTKLQVVDACSGLRYFLPLIILGILLAYYFRAAMWKRIALVLFAIPLSIITNSMRIASVGILYRFWGPVVVDGFFHDFSGWFIFMASLVMMLAVMWCLKRIFPDSQTAASYEKENGSVPAGIVKQEIGMRYAFLLAVPMFLLLGGTTLLANNVDFREKIPLRQPFSTFPVHVGDWQGERQVMDKVYLDSLELSDYLLIDYRNSQQQNINFYVAYNESQRGGKSSHSPATCLPGNGWEFKDSGITSVELPGGKVIKVQRAFMDKNGQKLLAYYWFSQRGRILHNLFELKLFAFWDAIVARRTDGALVRIITPVRDSGNLTESESRLKDFVRVMLPVLDQYLPGRTVR
jgi:exosortase D (VPLPA-CTERM-specific)